MEPSSLINQSRLSQKQLQHHLHQQRYYLENHEKYQQHNVHVPIPHFPPPPEYPPQHPSTHKSPQNHQNFRNFQENHELQEKQQFQNSHQKPQINRSSPQKYQQGLNHGHVSMEYENQNNQNNRVGDPSVSYFYKKLFL